MSFQHPRPDLGMSEKDCIESIRAYHATTSFMDAQAGRVLDELHRLNLDKKTVIIFMSDHGYLLGQHQAWQKTMLFEEACRVPMIVVIPGMKHGGETARGLVESIDMYPTVAELCGVKAPRELEGKSFVSLLNDPTKSFLPAAFTQVKRGNKGIGYSIRTDRYRYTEWNGGKDGVELYDHESDPHELRDVSKTESGVPIAAQLSEQLHEHKGKK